MFLSSGWMHQETWAQFLSFSVDVAAEKGLMSAPYCDAMTVVSLTLDCESQWKLLARSLGRVFYLIDLRKFHFSSKLWACLWRRYQFHLVDSNSWTPELTVSQHNNKIQKVIIQSAYFIREHLNAATCFLLTLRLCKSMQDIFNRGDFLHSRFWYNCKLSPSKVAARKTGSHWRTVVSRCYIMAALACGSTSSATD